MQLEQVGSTGLAFARNRSFCHGNACGNTKKQKNTQKKKKQHKTQKNPMLRHTMQTGQVSAIVCLNIGFFGFFGFFEFPDAFPLQNERFCENDCISITKSTIS